MTGGVVRVRGAAAAKGCCVFGRPSRQRNDAMGGAGVSSRRSREITLVSAGSFAAAIGDKGADNGRLRSSAGCGVIRVYQ